MHGNSAGPIDGAPPPEGSGRADRRFAALHSVLGLGAAAALFGAAIVPVGLVMRMLGRDRLRLRRDPAAASYWLVRDPPGTATGRRARPR